MYRLDRSDLTVVLFVFLAVIALGTVAATIDTVKTPEGESDTSGLNPDFSRGGVDPPGGDGGSGGDGGGTEGPVLNLKICIEFLTTTPAILGIVGVVFGMLYLTFRQFDPATALLVGVVVIPFVWVSYFFTTNCRGGGGGGGGGIPGGPDIGSSGGISAPSVPPALVAVFFAFVMVAGVVLLFKTTDEEETFEPIEDEPDEPDTAAFSRAAGRAADRIEEANVPVDNAVYRAWLEMTNLLNLDNPETAAPRTFAQEAIDVGLGSDDVEELTELFNEVRYGGENPDTREDQALEILRNIERTYQDSASETGGDN